MEEIIILNDENVNEIMNFIDNHVEDTLYFFNALSLENRIKKNNVFYAYKINMKIKGLFLFNSANVLFPFISVEDINKKVDFLRIIRKHKPIMIKGESKSVSIIWKIIFRSLKKYDYFECLLMKNTSFKAYDLEKLSYEESNDDLSENELNDSLKFLIDVEKEFNVNALSINRIKNKIREKIDDSSYVFIKKDFRIVAQGVIEFNFKNISIIGGIYTDKKYRNRGYASTITKVLVNKSIKSNQISYLTVLKNNKDAINIYNKLNFKKVRDYIIVNIEI